MALHRNLPIWVTLGGGVGRLGVLAEFISGVCQPVKLQETRLATCHGTFVLVMESANGYVLQVEAEASTNSNARPGFVPRQKPGLAIFGKSSNTPPAHPVRSLSAVFCRAELFAF